MTFDTLDKKYQKCPAFSADKAGLWLFPVEQDGWTLAHNGIRMEIEQMLDALKACSKRGAIQQWEVACVQAFWKAHYVHIHNHHSNEDDLLTPYLETRINYPEKLTSDHTELVAKLDSVDSIVKSLGQKEGDTVAVIVKEMTAYQDIMLPHLKEEEDMGLPLARAYFDMEEIGAVIQKILSGSPPAEMGCFIACQGIDEFRNGFMKRHHLPAIAWYASFKGCVAAFDREFAKPMEALKTGIEPTHEGCCAIQ